MLCQQLDKLSIKNYYQEIMEKMTIFILFLMIYTLKSFMCLPEHNKSFAYF
ncbi:hypothetical protein B4153_3461 [Bacillus cereus]|nr:hypothetical protein bcere0009_54020 [Bacillus cereus R309803]EEL25403.1 hypothetical protein bcere0018_56640 [Bacillus cereus Rock1-15]KLA01127.1 hypothetical protein B4153_3461 [Bacillus cereus]KLA18432.1 hypothetical protein B4087_5741 [Bacillus cereus]KZD56503.1 hypothetical protein B4088_5131 [Bacillus cereus]